MKRELKPGGPYWVYVVCEEGNQIGAKLVNAPRNSAASWQLDLFKGFSTSHLLFCRGDNNKPTVVLTHFMLWECGVAHPAFSMSQFRRLPVQFVEREAVWHQFSLRSLRFQDNTEEAHKVCDQVRARPHPMCLTGS